MRHLALLPLLLTIACAHQQRHSQPLPELPRYSLQSRLADVPEDEGGGGYVASVPYYVAHETLAQAEPPVGADGWLARAFNYTATTSAAGASAYTLNAQTRICMNGSACTTYLSTSAAGSVLVTSAANLMAGAGVALGASSNRWSAVWLSGSYSTNVAAGSNAYAVETNGARVDLGTGSNDFLVSDGTSVNVGNSAGSLISKDLALAATTGNAINVNSAKLVIAAASGKVSFDATDSSGTPGAATINKPSGQVSVAAGTNSVVVTNSLVSTTSVVLTVMQTNDSTCDYVDSVAPAAGSFTIVTSANCTGNTKIGFVVFN